MRGSDSGEGPSRDVRELFGTGIRVSRLPTADTQIHVLLVEDSVASARALQEALSDARGTRYRITQAGSLESALASLNRKPFDIVILDLGLVDTGDGPDELEGLDRMLAEMGDRSLPVVALCGAGDERSALLAIDHGAQDYLVKGDFEARGLRRTLLHALERHRIAAELQVARERERYPTTHHPLTQLPTRELFADRVVQAVASSQRTDAWLAVLMIELPLFREIAETHDRGADEELLQIMSHRLLSTLRATDSACWMGGNRFGVLVTSLAHALDAAKVARNLAAALTQPIHFGADVVQLDVRAGIAIYPNDGDSAESLLRNSDAALSSAIQESSCHSYFHTKQMTRSSRELLSLEDDLKRAIDRKGLTLHYQPIVDGRDGRVVGGEAMVRWRDSQRGAVSPEAFIPLAEDAGFIDRMDQWALQQTCRDLRAWREAALSPVPMAVNISPQQFWHSDFHSLLNAVLDEEEIEPSLLEINLREACLVREVDSTTAVLRAIRERGVRVSIDDFGQGYSCLNVLRRLPVDTLKIAAHLLRNATRDVNSAMATTAIIGLASNLGLEIIAVGVETDEQRSFLLERQCSMMQGYFFGPAVAADSFARLLSAGRVEMPVEKPLEP